MRSKRGLLLTAAVVLAVDGVSKLAAVRFLATGDVELLGPALALRLGYNSGVAFGIGVAAPTVVVLGVTAMVTAAVAVAAWRGLFGHPGAAGLVLGGALGNVIDRAVGGSVVDMIDIGSWPTFNVADICINVGVALAVLTAFRPPASARAPEENPAAPTRGG